MLYTLGSIFFNSYVTSLTSPSTAFITIPSFLGGGAQGLTTTFATQVLERDGPNELKPPKGTPEYVKFARQLAGGLQCLMWVAAVICFIAFGIELGKGEPSCYDDVCGAGRTVFKAAFTWAFKSYIHGIKLSIPERVVCINSCMYVMLFV